MDGSLGAIRIQRLMRHLRSILLVLIFAVQPLASVHAQPRPEQVGGKGQPCPIVQQGLIILVEFPDVSHTLDKRYAQKRFFKELNEYVQEMSYGKVCIQGDVTDKWYRMPHPIAEYRISSRNLEVDKSRLTKLILDALAEVDKDVNLSKYSFVAIFMAARLKDYGMIGLCGYPGMLGWGTQELLKTKSGQVVRGGVAIFSYQAHLGTLFHDTAHILGGVKEGKRMVPCLYDHDLQAKPGPMRETFVDAIINLGFWDPMSCHYYKWEIPPPGISSWTRMRLDWLDPSKVRVIKAGERGEALLGPLEDPKAETLAIKIPVTKSAYYLIENRQAIGFDSNLPGNGVLIMHADDHVAECRHGESPVKLVNANPSVPHLEGAAFDIGKNTSYVDSRHNVKIELIDKIGNSYKIQVSPYQ
jgi:M6 family metalloprotease-like protein